MFFLENLENICKMFPKLAKETTLLLTKDFNSRRQRIMWLLFILLFCWLSWKILNFSLKYILPIALILLMISYAIKFLWLALIILGIGYLYHRRNVL